MNVKKINSLTAQLLQQETVDGSAVKQALEREMLPLGQNGQVLDDMARLAVVN